MAQKRIFEYLADDKTFDINNTNVGILPKGIYAGYDVAVIKPRLDVFGVIIGSYLEISHTTTAIIENNESGSLMTPFSVLMTSQGVRITEDSVIEIEITSFPSTGTRYDYVICEHDYVPVSGGSQAVYSIIQGDETNSLPLIPTQQNKIIVGVLKIDINASSTWKRAEVPQIGNADIRNIASRLGAMWAEGYSNTVQRPTAGFLNLPKTANTFDVLEASTTNTYLAKSIAFLPDYGNSYGIHGTKGAIVRLVAVEDVVIMDKNELDDLLFATPIGQKQIFTGTGASVTIKTGGTVILLETLLYWSVITVFDTEKNNFHFSNQLKNKNLWGFEPLFQSAVSLSAASILMRQSLYPSNVSLDSNGLIQNGIASTQRNVYTLNTTSNVAILGIKVPFSIGAEVTIFFEGTDTVLHTNVSAFPNNQRIISRDGFSVLAVAGSSVTGIQKSDGFYLINGEPYEIWESPTLPNNVSVIAANGTFRFKICRSGRIEFDGSISMVANSGTATIVSLPRTLFKFQDWTLPKRVFVPPLITQSGGISYLNNMDYHIDGTAVKFTINTDNNETTFNFNGCYIHYK